mmetsp:Transcript_18283/g.38028  ORF Transcript_18283/g.38028 Transcript_18283/m.38028 type:complete len:80 (-) Transcript_18283:190-429(-)
MQRRLLSSIVSNKTTISSLLSKPQTAIFAPIIPSTRTAMSSLPTPSTMSPPAGIPITGMSGVGGIGDVKVMSVVKKVVR